MPRDIIFEQEEPLKRPYTAKDLLNRASNPHLDVPAPYVDSGSWLENLFRTRRLTRAEATEKVAQDLGLTLEQRDECFVFRFPDVWSAKDVQAEQEKVLEGIAMIEERCNASLVLWLKDFFAAVVTGLNFLFGRQIMIDDDEVFRIVKIPYASPIPQGGDATIPVPRQTYELGYSTKDAAHALFAIGQALPRIPYMRTGEERLGKSDSQYDEPQATYPPMEMKQCN